MNICFILDPWADLNPEIDSSLRVIHEAALRGHKVAIFQPKNLTIRENETYAFANILTRMDKVPESIPAFYKKAKFRKQMVPLKGFDAVFLRKDPPIDNLMLNFLDSVKDDTFIINSVDGLRKANNKIYVTSFEEAADYIPETYVSKDIDYLEQVINDCKKDKMILKPLDGFGGHGVIVLETKAKQNIRSLLEFYISGSGSKNYVILQEYIEGADKGDVRVLMLNGEPIGAMKRIPKEGDARSNVHAGGTARKHVMTKTELEICRCIGAKLVHDGIYFAGLDIINGKLLEINVLSPGGITRINKFNKTKLQKRILDFVELVHKRRENAVNRKINFRKVIEDA
ncbi:glutathione synthase [Bacteriovorax sp. Seq25_V]|uniref:glutathione synthase n=1 Tax=Bacteriovorax sp. Seq25_V TaxID=1201288 RepID=UPI00038A43E6|nr:glutathione synthase [Bacteriovorax sp. Seq25_V]EQC46784.1 prokaryotic glutathione synthetase, N-terminal domain/glutathione synthetase, ATP-binding domain multi-domain protein [Bacteriovorax sp. Seq25_V]